MEEPPSAIAMRSPSPWREIVLLFPGAGFAFGMVVGMPWPLTAGWTAAFSALAFGSWRMELRVDGRGLVVCNGFRTRQVAWAEVRALDWRRRWPWGQVVVATLRDDQLVVLGMTRAVMVGGGDSELEGRAWVERLERLRDCT